MAGFHVGDQALQDRLAEIINRNLLNFDPIDRMGAMSSAMCTEIVLHADNEADALEGLRLIYGDMVNAMTAHYAARERAN